MAEPVYKVVEVVGTSEESVSKAIDRAIAKAGQTLRQLGWWEVQQILRQHRGQQGEALSGHPQSRFRPGGVASRDRPRRTGFATAIVTEAQAANPVPPVDVLLKEAHVTSRSLCDVVSCSR